VEDARGLAVGILAIGESEFSRARESRHHKSRNADKIRAVHLRDMCQRSSTHRHIINREIGFPKDKRNGTLEVLKSRRNQDRPSRRMRGSHQHTRENPRQESAWRTGVRHLGRVGNRHIRDPRHKGFVHYRIAIRDFPTRYRSMWDHQSQSGRQLAHRISGARKWKS